MKGDWYMYYTDWVVGNGVLWSQPEVDPDLEPHLVSVINAYAADLAGIGPQQRVLKRWGQGGRTLGKSPWPLEWDVFV